MEFTDENITMELARDFEVDPDEISLITTGDWIIAHISGYGEYAVVENDDVAERVAVEQVKRDIRDEPELFGDYLEGYVDMPALRQWVLEAVLEDDYAAELARDPREFWKEADEWGLTLPTEDEDGNLPDEVNERYIDELQTAIANRQAQRPMDYFEDMYGREEATKQAMAIVGVDAEAAAQDLVRNDGWQNTLCHDNGESYETGSGFVYWILNGSEPPAPGTKPPTFEDLW